MIEKLDDYVDFYKIGYQLFFGGDGLALGKELISAGKDVFFDLKLLDIDNTVAKGVEAIADTGARFLTVHGYPKAMAAAAEAAAGSKLEILGVSVLTSMDDDDLMDAGYDRDVESLVGLRAHQAQLANIGGLVCSAFESAMVRELVGPEMHIVTPGIRPANANLDDQKRAMSPSHALEQGASHLVVGRPITKSPSPKQEVAAIVADMASVQ